jgi:hypothetical protein
MTGLNRQSSEFIEAANESWLTDFYAPYNEQVPPDPRWVNSEFPVEPMRAKGATIAEIAGIAIGPFGTGRPLTARVEPLRS